MTSQASLAGRPLPLMRGVGRPKQHSMRVGFDPTTKRELFVLELDSLAELPVSIRLASPRFVCLLAWDAARSSDQELAQVADWLLRSGAVYVCCWGADCERVHDAVDAEDMRRNPTCDPVVMTTWHTTEPLSEVLWFVLNSAWPDDGYANGCGSTLAICIGNPEWAVTARASFADPILFTNRLSEVGESPAYLTVCSRRANCGECCAISKRPRLIRSVRPAAPAAGRTSPAACGRLFGHVAAPEQAAEPRPHRRARSPLGPRLSRRARSATEHGGVGCRCRPSQALESCYLVCTGQHCGRCSIVSARALDSGWLSRNASTASTASPGPPGIWSGSWCSVRA